MKEKFKTAGVINKKIDSRDCLFYREDLVYNVTEDILVIMEDKSISKKQLADRLGKTRSYVTQLLSGARNMTLGTLSDICYAIDVKPQIKLLTHNLIIDGTCKPQQFQGWETVIFKDSNYLSANEIIRANETNAFNFDQEPKWEAKAA